MIVYSVSSAPCSRESAQAAGPIAPTDHAAFELLMRQHNGRLFRVARAILKDDTEAEDALQDAYLAAFRHIGDFKGGAQIGTWLTRIVINQALMRLRRQKRDSFVVSLEARPETEANSAEADAPDEHTESPPSAALRAEVRRLLERGIDELPIAFRTVFVMHEVEDLTAQEIGDCLSIPAATVRTRLFRARALLRKALAREIDDATIDVFSFGGERCDRVVSRVLARLRV